MEACCKYNYEVKFRFGHRWLAVILSRILISLEERKTEIEYEGEKWILVDGHDLFFCLKTKKHRRMGKIVVSLT